jgi:hypothetical protein
LFGCINGLFRLGCLLPADIRRLAATIWLKHFKNMARFGGFGLGSNGLEDAILGAAMGPIPFLEFLIFRSGATAPFFVLTQT